MNIVSWIGEKGRYHQLLRKSKKGKEKKYWKGKVGGGDNTNIKPVAHNTKIMPVANQKTRRNIKINRSGKRG